MGIALYGHPFSSYHQKVLIALYENAIPFELRLLGGDERVASEHRALWPFQKMPVMVDDGRTVVESTIIIEHLDLHHPGPVRMIPEDRRSALDVRMLDRVFDGYVMTPMQKIVADVIRAAPERDPKGVADAHATLDTAYRWLDVLLKDRTWGAGESFGLADCAAAPSLFYADWVHPIGDTYPNVRDYRKRLLARP